MRIANFPADFSLCQDYVFKAVFTTGSPESKGALTSLLSAFLGRKVLSAIPTLNEPPSDAPRRRKIRFDISVRFDDGELADIEMMLDPRKADLIRIQYYLARLFVNQDATGTNIKNLKHTWQISIADRGNFFEDNELFHEFVFVDQKRNTALLGGLMSILTLELKKLDHIVSKPVAEMSKLERWSVFFRYYTDESKRKLLEEIVKAEEGIAMAEQVVLGWTQSEIEGIWKIRRDIAEMEYNQDIDDAREEGLEKGRVEGWERGSAERSFAIARNALAEGASPEFVQKITGLDTATIQSLAGQ